MKTKYKYKSCFLVLALLATTAIARAAAERPNITLQQEEIAEIMSAQETYAYFGPAMCSLVADLPALTKMARASGMDAKHLDALCELVSQGYTTAPATMVKAAVEEAAACVAACKAELAAEELTRIADALEQYDHALQSGAADLVIADESDDAETATRGTKKFDNIIVRNRAAIGSLFVGGDETVHHNLTVDNDLLVKGNEIINGTLTVRGATIFSGTSTTISGDLKVLRNIKLPDANTAGTVGVLQLGVDPIYLYNTGTSNFFAGDYTAGLNTSVTGANNISIGTNANSTLTTANNTIAIGAAARATNASATAIGMNSIASGSAGIAVGPLSQANGASNIAIGPSAIGSSASTSGIALGDRAIVDGVQNIAFGTVATATGGSFNAIAIGTSAKIGGVNAVAIGNGAVASAAGSLALGDSTNATGTNSISMGTGTSSAANGIAIGEGVTVLGDHGIAIGTNTMGTGANTIAIGVNANNLGAPSGISSIAIGNSAQAINSFATAIGISANASGGNSIALGSNVTTTADSQIRIGTGGGYTSFFIPESTFGATIVGGNPLLVDAIGHVGGVVSSKRFKENFRSLDMHSAQIYKLNPVKFDYKIEHGGGKDQFGLLAEDVAQHIPEIVTYDAQGQIHTVQYHVLPTLLLNEMKHHQRKFEAQDAVIAQLLSRIAVLEAALQKTR